MSRTINGIRAKIQLMRNFAEQAKKIGDEICDMFDDASDDIFDMLNSIQDCEMSIEEAMEELRRCERLNGLEEGPELLTPIVSYDNVGAISVKKPCNGGFLVGYVNESDFGTAQAGVEWRGNTEETDYPIDLCLAEVVSGELAETYKLPAENKDVFVYIYGDASDDGYTSKNIIAYRDICNALEVPVSKTESKPKAKKTAKKSTKASVTMQFKDENGRVEECYTVKAAMPKDELKEFVESCIAISYRREDIDDDDSESIDDCVPADVLNYLAKIGKTVRWSDLAEGGFYEALEEIFEAMEFSYEKTAPAKGCDIVERW